MEGGSTQEGDDITAQPLKDELFLPPLGLPQSASQRLLIGEGTSSSPAGRWTPEEGAAEVPAQLALDKVGAGQGLVQPPRLRWEDRWSRYRGRAGRWVL